MNSLTKCSILISVNKPWNNGKSMVRDQHSLARFLPPTIIIYNWGPDQYVQTASLNKILTFVRQVFIPKRRKATYLRSKKY